ncbi:T9SS type A sorting domain-containing protein [Aureibaculum sp. 2210JD6-5]|uniref:T9SS type A sorting domain-containing protein n=1 Tax=Aureibaculum sp. 2210JD6-5 TaxID=3103957 RepID=UPI002AAECC09|nr:T9SS type A sorting domain-containing protein [Aureibaculum sp. 2210JD6-5]MDY7395014.1 T9SS type A sorting domain-containing protein [Aureibaculum sp. 2210JD6-5]
MRKAILLYMLYCACQISNAQIQEENFDAASIPSGWSATAGPTGCTWEFGYTGSLIGSGFSNPASFSSGGVIFNDNSCGSFVDNFVELEGPAIDLIAANVVSAAIEIVYNHQAFGNSGNFMIDVWDGSIWQNVLFVNADDPAPNTATNQTTTIDVTAYINNAFKVKFIYDDENTYTWGVGIDHYKLLNTATASITDLAEVGFIYSPNPVTNNVLLLKADENISVVNIYNTIGQRVLSKKPVALESKVFMDNLPNGVYLVQVEIGERNGTFKIIK